MAGRQICVSGVRPLTFARMTANVQDDDEPRWERPDGNLIS